MERLREVVFGLTVGLAMTAFGTNANAIEVSETATYSASADEVWDVVKQFGGLEKWHPWFATTSTYGEDGVFYRRIVTHDGGWALETLDEFSWSEKSYTYSVVGGVFPLANYTATLKVTSAGSGSEVNWSSSFDAVGMPDEDVRKLIIDAYQAGFESVGKLVGE